MSTDVTAYVEVQPESVEVDVLLDRSIVVSNDHCITPENPDSIVSALKKEYSVVGDAFYASVSAEDAPQWLLSIIDTTVDNAVARGMVDYDLLVQDVRSAIDALDTAANTYVEEINFDARVDSIVGTHLVTLNATLENTYATIVDLNTVVANSDYALTQAVSDLTSAYTDEINSRITTIQTAYTDADTSLASDITALTAAFTDQEGNLSAMANAVSGLQTYVGLSPEGDPDGTGMLSAFTDLDLALSALNTDIFGESGLEQTLEGAITSEGTRVESLFEYNSGISINGIGYTAGFGLVNSATLPISSYIPAGQSEFWIDAQKFRFTNSAKSGSVSPFTIDASGPTPQITFNGNVAFSNIDEGPTHTTGSADPTGVAVVGSTYTQTSTTPNTLWVYGVSGWVRGGDPNALTTISGGTITTGTIRVYDDQSTPVLRVEIGVLS